jgi:hypothetical protein
LLLFRTGADADTSWSRFPVALEGHVSIPKWVRLAVYICFGFYQLRAKMDLFRIFAGKDRVAPSRGMEKCSSARNV